MSHPSPLVGLRVLGTVALRDADGTEIVGVLDRPKQMAVLFYLALAEPRGLQRRDTLLALLWPELSETRARVALNKATHSLRKLIGADVLLRPTDVELGVVFDRMECDAVLFSKAVDGNDHQAALALYGGELLAGLHVADAPEFMQWLDERRRALRRQAVHSALTLAHAKVEALDLTAAVDLARRARHIDPLDEHALRLELGLLDRRGDRAAALREYGEFSAFLAREYETEPSPETRALVQGIRARRDPGDARDLGIGQGPPLAERPRSLASDTVHRSDKARPRWRMVIGVSASLVGLVAAVSFAAARAGRPSDAVPAMSATTVAVMPFTLRGAPEHLYLGEGVMTLLAEQLDGVGTLKSVSPRLVLLAAPSGSAVMSDDSVSSVATRFGAGLIVSGTIIETGGQLHISAELTDHRQGKVLGRASATGEIAKVFDLVASVATQLATQANVQMTVTPQPLSEATQTVAALRAYLDGERAFRDGSYNAAVDAFQRAVELDSNFALAHWRLSVAAQWAGSGETIRSALAHAARLSARLSPAARQHVRAMAAYNEHEWERSLALYQDLLRRNPADADAATQAAEIRFHFGAPLGRPMSESEPDWRRVLALEPGNAGALLHLAHLAALAGDRPTFERYAVRLQSSALETDRRVQLRAMRAFAFGDSAARWALRADLTAMPVAQSGTIYQRVAALTPDLYGITEIMTPLFLSGAPGLQIGWIRDTEAQVNVARGRLREMRRVFAIQTKRYPESALMYEALFLTLPYVPLDSARARTLLAVLDGAARPDINGIGTGLREPYHTALRGYAQGLVALRLGDFARAERAVRRIDATRPAPADTLARRLGVLLRAEILARRGQARAALATLGAPRHFPSYVFAFPAERERMLRGELHEALGDYDVARRWYATFPTQDIGDNAFLPWARYREGLLHERAGDRVNAHRCFQRTLALMSRADPELQPFVSELRDRLGR